MPCQNSFAPLSVSEPHPNSPVPTTIPPPQPPISTASRTSKLARRIQRRRAKRLQRAFEVATIDAAITSAEDERTTIAKADNNSVFQQSITERHRLPIQPSSSLLQRGRNWCYSNGTCLRRFYNRISTNRNVQFSSITTVKHFLPHVAAASSIIGQSEPRQLVVATMPSSPQLSKSHLTRLKRRRNKQARKLRNTNIVYASYDSAADGNYTTEVDRATLNMPILRPSTKRVAVANGKVEHGVHRTVLPLPDSIPSEIRQGDSFNSFTNTLLSVGRMANAGYTSIFTKHGVQVIKDEDVLIRLQGKPVMIGIRDENGRFKIPLVANQHGKYKPRIPTNKDVSSLEQANNVYDLPSVEEGIKWLHAACGYPVQSTWLKAVRNGHFRGWPLITERTVKKYYPETSETILGHMQQQRKNVRSTKRPFEVAETTSLRGKRNAMCIFISMIHETQLSVTKPDDFQLAASVATNTSCV